MNTWRRMAVGITALTAAACNIISGADQVEFVPDMKVDASTTTGNGGGNGSESAATSGSGNVDPDTTTGSGSMVDTTPVLADGISVTEVKLYQGVERPLMKGGAPISSKVPIVAGRDAYLRVFYSAQQPMEVTLQLDLGDGGEPLEVPAKVSGTSNQASLASSVNVMVPGARLANATGFRVSLLVPGGAASGSNSAASYPASGLADLPVESAGSTMKLVLVPIAYEADGSKRLPDTSAEQVERYRKAFFRLYPIPNITVTVKPAVSWKQKVDPGGSGWDDLLNAIVDYRQKSGAGNDEYYYGVFNAAASFASFCSQGCVAGLSLLAGPNDAMARAGIGVGFTGDETTGTAAHEIGHQHGRPHAPCGVSQSVDPLFPHKDGSIGTWGFDLITKQLIKPDAPDFMSYCHPEWISDFNFGKLFDRLKLVNNAAWLGGEEVVYERVAIDAAGRARWLGEVTNASAPSGEPTTLEVETDDGPEQLVGHFYPYSHVGGGVMLVPRTKAPLRSLDFSFGGARIHLPR
ncbi:MAG: hypothetical protein FJ095_01265 [Deltaproteobacteria bacterium]|nr:hypothetical protein [Deltaproteobacteria bacterium]